MIFARTTTPCATVCERAVVSSSARSLSSSSIRIGVFHPITASLTVLASFYWTPGSGELYLATIGTIVGLFVDLPAANMNFVQRGLLGALWGGIVGLIIGLILGSIVSSSSEN